MNRNAIESFEHNGLTVQIVHDDDAESPRETCDNMTVLACWHRRSNLGDKQIEGGMTAKELIRSLRAEGEKVLALLPLYAYEHGGITMSTGSFSCRFDSGQVGWGYVTQSSAEEMGCVGTYTDRETGETKAYDKAFFEEAIRLDVRTYADYLEGQCYGYTVEDDDGTEVASCWGFVGDLEYVRTEAIDAANHADNPARDRMIAEQVAEFNERATQASVF